MSKTNFDAEFEEDNNEEEYKETDLNDDDDEDDDLDEEPAKLSVPVTPSVTHNTPSTPSSAPDRLLMALLEETRRAGHNHSPIELKAPKFSKVTLTTWTVFVAAYKIYKQNGGQQHMVQLFLPAAQVIVATYLEMPVADFLLLSSMTLQQKLNIFFDISDATGADEILQAITMIECTADKWNRTNIETYMQTYMDAVYNSPNMLDISAGGVTPKRANAIFINGLQPDAFREMVKKHETKDLTKTIKAVNIEIKAFKAFLRIHLSLLKPSGPSTAKASSRPPPSKLFTASKSHLEQPYPCGNCQGDHLQRLCPKKNECLPCKTKTHSYWAPECLEFQKWVAKKKAADPTFFLKPRINAARLHELQRHQFLQLQ